MAQILKANQEKYVPLDCKDEEKEVWHALPNMAINCLRREDVMCNGPLAMEGINMTAWKV